jgi:hypothetical protein
MVRQARRGVEGLGPVRLGEAGEAWPGMAQQGKARQVRQFI